MKSLPMQKNANDTFLTDRQQSAQTPANRRPLVADVVFLAALLGAGTLIWLRDTAWLTASEETVPILAALPLFLWLGAPWRFKADPFRIQGAAVCIAAVVLTLGLAFDLTFGLAAAWILVLWSWTSTRLEPGRFDLRRLMILPLMSFPWLTLDLVPLGWWFRLSAAWVVEHLFGMIGYTVARHGTMLLVQGVPVDVAPACSGMNSLQAMLLAGVVLAWIELRSSRWYWVSILVLPLLAWAANVARVAVLTGAGLGMGVAFASGSFHETGGWLAVILIFLGWWLVIRSGGPLRKPEVTRA